MINASAGELPDVIALGHRQDLGRGASPMIESFVAAARLPQTDPHQAAGIGQAEGRATLALLRALGDGDWTRPTDCTEWDVRALVAHLVAQCEDSIRLGTLLRRELLGRRRYHAKVAVDAHMAVGVDDHRNASGPELVERFALLWPRTVRARRRRPGFLRRIKVNSGIPGLPRWPVAYLLDVILNRDLWMHRVDLSRATGRPLVIGGHDRQIVAQIVRDLALGWSAAPVALELTGPAGGFWLLGSGDPVAVVRADAVAYVRALSGCDDDVVLDLLSGHATALTPSARPESPSDRLVHAFAWFSELRQISAHASCTNPSRMPSDPWGDPASAQRPPAAWVAVALVACGLAGRLRGRPGRPQGPLIAGTASTRGSSSTES